MKTVSVIGIVGIPACYGGFETLVENLTLFSSGSFNYEVFCSSMTYGTKVKTHNNAKLIYMPIKANGVKSIFFDILSLIYCLKRKPEVTLILGVSGCIFLPIYKALSTSKIITNIDGLEWKRNKWGKLTRKFLKLSESIAVKYSDTIITDNQAIADYVEQEYRKKSIVIAYGGDHVIPISPPVVYPQDYFFSLCRIEPENNVELILKAFSSTQNIKLKFIGNWDGSLYGKKLKDQYSKYKNIEILDPIYDINILYELRKGCVGYIHGHSAGGTNPSLVEAMHFEKPIFAFDCSFNRYSTENDAFYFLDFQDLISKLNNITSVSMENCSKSMKEIAMRRYKWDTITQMYEKLYL
ncbi:DUF1972 domain-containing protein [Xenorhabdus bharatensis]|uniref:DUF1972 domain-containing protein n=1 Tax=Xenorhabdus bharatensis TaxID=3136256 RepID=UPI0030F492F9